MGKRRTAKEGQATNRAADEPSRVDAQEQRRALEHLGFTINTHRHIILLALATLLLKSLIFAPIDFWPLSFVCLVPWLILIGAAGEARRVYFYSYLLGLAFFLWNMRWLYHPTGAGYIVLSVYLALYFPLVACPIRHAVRRRRMPLGLVVPLVWTGSEMVRAVAVSGFPWFFLSHSLHDVLTLIQVSDLVGAYGVSFLVAAVNGAVADVVFARLAARRALKPAANRRQARFSVAFAAVLAFAVIVYGQIQLHRDTVSEGPKVAVLQGDFINRVSGEGLPEPDKMDIYFSMMKSAAAADPDLFLLPESPWFMYLNPEARDRIRLWRVSFEALRNHAIQDNAYVVTGCGAEVETPYDVLAKTRRYNSAMVFNPNRAEPQRYDKIHLVYFGEIVPFRFGRLRFLYFWINALMPFSGPDNDEYSFFRGEEFRRFTMEAPSRDGQPYRFGIPICYEDVMPYVSRAFVSGSSDTKQVDFLLNISNDGWFGRGIQQPQHLAICVFRAVENRIGIARAVNTGVSAFIQPTGRVHEVVVGDPATPWPGNCGYAVARLGVDSRYAFYSRHGDWFAWTCAVLGLLLYGDYFLVRALSRKEE